MIGLEQQPDKKIRLSKGIENTILQIFKVIAPIVTGALEGRIYIEYTEYGFNIVSDIYYMPYTEERWLSAKWRGRENPNEGWFREANEQAMRFLSNLIGKELKRES